MPLAPIFRGQASGLHVNGFPGTVTVKTELLRRYVEVYIYGPDSVIGAVDIKITDGVLAIVGPGASSSGKYRADIAVMTGGSVISHIGEDTGIVVTQHIGTMHGGLVIGSQDVVLLSAPGSQTDDSPSMVIYVPRGMKDIQVFDVNAYLST